MIPETTIQTLRQTNLLDVVGHYVKLKKAGNQWTGICPFHNEKTSSFFVHPEKGYKCFGCGASGHNAIDFIRAIEGLTFPEAAERLAAMTGTFIGAGVPAKPMPKIKPIQPVKQQMVDYIPEDLIAAYMAAYRDSHLYQFHVSLFGLQDADSLCCKYGIGACDYYGPGTAMLPCRDIDGHIRQVKVIPYDPFTGKRDRNRVPRIIGRQIMKDPAANLTMCLCGEHLLNRPEYRDLPVAVVESEKAAMIASMCYPEYLWLATGGKNGCNLSNPEVNKPLRGRHIHLFPDVDGTEDWRRMAAEMQRQGLDVFLNDTMAKYAVPGSKDDIADLILQKRDANGRLRVPIDSMSKDRWAILNRLLNKGYKACKQYGEGQITVQQWDVVQDEIIAGLRKHGISFNDYVQAASFIKNTQ